MDFNQVLKTKVETVERPPLVPHGTYLGAISKIPVSRDINTANFNGNIVDFNIKLLRAMDDVDADSLREYGSLASAMAQHSFMFNKDDDNAFQRTLFNLRRFLEDTLKIDLSDGKDFSQAFNETVNRQFLVTIKWEPDKNNKEIMYARVNKTAPVE
jgi:hypothetical protein